MSRFHIPENKQRLSVCFHFNIF